MDTAIILKISTEITKQAACNDWTSVKIADNDCTASALQIQITVQLSEIILRHAQI